MGRLVKQTIITILFLAQLALVWALNRDVRDTEALSEAEALERHGFHLRECAKKCGIDFTHEPPGPLSRQLRHIESIIASMGAAVSIVDFDRDGLPDIYVVTSKEGGKNRLYRNLG